MKEEIKLNVTSETIAATSRKLKATWSMEAYQDCVYWTGSNASYFVADSVTATYYGNSFSPFKKSMKIQCELFEDSDSDV